MKNCMIELFKNSSKAEIEKLIKEKGKYSVLSIFSEIMDKRSYFTVDKDGNIKQSSVNPILILFSHENDPSKLAKFVLSYGNLKERIKISKINRMSNLEIDILEKNLMKTLVSGNLDFSKRYAKELYLRDANKFFKVIFTFSLMGNMNSFKTVVALAFKKIMSEVIYDENIFYLFIAFLTKYRDDFSDYINSSSEKAKIENLICDSILTKSYIKVLKEYDYPNKHKFENMFLNKFEYFNDEKEFSIRISV